MRRQSTDSDNLVSKAAEQLAADIDQIIKQTGSLTFAEQNQLLKNQCKKLGLSLQSNIIGSEKADANKFMKQLDSLTTSQKAAPTDFFPKSSSKQSTANADINPDSGPGLKK